MMQESESVQPQSERNLQESERKLQKSKRKMRESERKSVRSFPSVANAYSILLRIDQDFTQITVSVRPVVKLCFLQSFIFSWIGS